MNSRPVAPAIPPRRFVAPRVSPPTVPSRWELCTQHPGNNYSAICKSCIRFLCKECMAQVPFEHEQCRVAFLDIDLYETCEDLVSRLNRKMNTTKSTMLGFRKALSKKRERMFKKRNETVSEIERYFTSLKEKFIQKLHNEETALLKYLTEKVTEQDEIISKNIEQCKVALTTVDNNSSLVANLSRLCGAQRGGNSVNFLKSIVQTSNDINVCNDSKSDIESTRDASHVISFSVDLETEQAIINSNVASVEFRDSRAEDRTAEPLDASRVEEPVGVVTTTVEGSNEQSPVQEPRLIDEEMNEPLRVALPPVAERPRSVASVPTTPVTSSDLVQLGVTSDSLIALTENAFGRESPCEISDIHSLAQTSTNNDAENEMLTEINEEPNTLHCEREITTPELLTEDEGVVTHVPTDISCADQSTESCDLSDLANDGEISETLAVEEQIASPCSPGPSGDPEAEGEDDPPPPYPGLPRAQPGPNEAPPPYPGPPPPPYTQNPVPRRRPAGDLARSRHPEHALSRDSANAALVAAMSISPAIQSEAPSTSGLKITKVFSVNEIHDKRSAGIFALAVVRSNCFVVVDRWNKKLKYFDPSGDSFGGLIFREEPWDVTLVTADLVAVTVPKLKTLYKIQVTDQSVLTTSTVSTLRKYACVSYHHANETFVCGQVPQFGEPVVDVIGINGGPILKTFRQDSDARDRCMFSYPRYVKVTDDGIVIVCDWNLKCLLLFNLDGSFVGRYKGTVDFPLNEPTGMAYDSEKQEIYVIDSKYSSISAAIHTVNLACECKDIIRWDNELRVSPAISPCRPGFAVGSKSGVVSLFTARHSRSSSSS